MEKIPYPWAYPVIWIDNTGCVEIIHGDLPMHYGDARFLKIIPEMDIKIIEKNHIVWEIIAANVVKKMPLFSLFPKFIFERPFILEFFYGDVKFLDLRDIQSLIINAFNKDLDCLPEERPKFNKSLLGCQDIESIFEFIGNMEE
ncbi:hypothetical protein [Woodsholea maritima]|uniref:hypothetical protein n=1 Tax=Woodsholea maritima TaxID=240237 RepID=UPI0012EADA66|nr:hypothetical protein [Woodsholea maritima]